MTATMTPYRPPQRAGRDGFPQLLHAEWTKFRTVRGWVIGMIVSVLVNAGIGLFLLSATGDGYCNSQTSQGGSGRVQHGAAACGEPALLLGPGGQPVTDSFYF